MGKAKSTSEDFKPKDCGEMMVTNKCWPTRIQPDLQSKPFVHKQNVKKSDAPVKGAFGLDW